MSDLPTADAAHPRPALRAGHHVCSDVFIEIAVPIETLEPWFRAVPLEQILPGHGSIPATTGSRPAIGVWNDPGARRRVLMADGSSVLEEVLARDVPDYFTYLVWGFKPPLGLLVRYGRGEFFFTAQGPNTTRLGWAYHFAPRTILAVPLLALIVRRVFKPFMQACIGTIRDVAERDAAAQKPAP
jgi:hypothetical protein